MTKNLKKKKLLKKVKVNKYQKKLLPKMLKRLKKKVAKKKKPKLRKIMNDGYHFSNVWNA